jgi:translation initiation factor 1
MLLLVTRPRIVWDSALGRIDPQQPPKGRAQPPPGDGVVRIRRETGKRGGKTVTTVRGVQLPAAELEALAGELKKRCGVGGTVADFVIELQGDQRDRVEELLRARGYTVVRVGG